MKSTKLETERRILEVQQWIIDGKADYLILSDIVSQFGVGIRQAKNIYQKATDSWFQTKKVEIEKKRVLKVDQLKNRMIKLEDKYQNTPQGLRVLLAYDKHIDKLEGIIPEKVHIHRGDAENPIAAVVITSAEERKQVEDEIQKLLNKTK